MSRHGVTVDALLKTTPHNAARQYPRLGEALASIPEKRRKELYAAWNSQNPVDRKEISALLEDCIQCGLFDVVPTERKAMPTSTPTRAAVAAGRGVSPPALTAVASAAAIAHSNSSASPNSVRSAIESAPSGMYSTRNMSFLNSHTSLPERIGDRPLKVVPQRRPSRHLSQSQREMPAGEMPPHGVVLTRDLPIQAPELADPQIDREPSDEMLGVPELEASLFSVAPLDTSVHQSASGAKSPPARRTTQAGTPQVHHFSRGGGTSGADAPSESSSKGPMSPLFLDNLLTKDLDTVVRDYPEFAVCVGQLSSGQQQSLRDQWATKDPALKALLRSCVSQKMFDKHAHGAYTFVESAQNSANSESSDAPPVPVTKKRASSSAQRDSLEFSGWDRGIMDAGSGPPSPEHTPKKGKAPEAQPSTVLASSSRTLPPATPTVVDSAEQRDVDWVLELPLMTVKRRYPRFKALLEEVPAQQRAKIADGWGLAADAGLLRAVRGCMRNGSIPTHPPPHRIDSPDAVQQRPLEELIQVYTAFGNVFTQLPQETQEHLLRHWGTGDDYTNKAADQFVQKALFVAQ